MKKAVSRCAHEMINKNLVLIKNNMEKCSNFFKKKFCFARQIAQIPASRPGFEQSIHIEP
jgi:hypothetical protein